METVTLRFFLGANTPDGFVGHTDALYDPRAGWRVFLIKGGAGSGKSTLLRAVAAAMQERGLDVECLVCSSDPRSLDGVRVPAVRVCVLDATAPHVVEPRYWGAVETLIDLTGAFDAEFLADHAAALMDATDRCAVAHARTRRLLSGAATLLGDNRRLAAAALNTAKLARATDALARREFGATAKPVRTCERGREHRRFLSAVTPEGEVTLYDTLTALAPRIFAVEDEHGAVAAAMLERLREEALDAGQTVIPCFCPLDPLGKPEHLILPDAGLAFTTANRHHPADFPVFRRIHATRFTDTAALGAHKQRMQFNRKAADELLREAVQSARGALNIHDDIERYSHAPMDREALQAISGRALARITAAADRRLGADNEKTEPETSDSVEKEP